MIRAALSIIRRRPLLSTAALLAVLLGGGYPAWSWWVKTAPLRLFGRVQVGMTPAEVTAATGKPADRRFEPRLTDVPDGLEADKTTGLPLREFAAMPGCSAEGRDTEDYAVIVGYDANNQVVACYLFGRSTRDGFLDPLLDWLGR